MNSDLSRQLMAPLPDDAPSKRFRIWSRGTSARCSRIQSHRSTRQPVSFARSNPAGDWPWRRRAQSCPRTGNPTLTTFPSPALAGTCSSTFRCHASPGSGLGSRLKRLTSSSTEVRGDALVRERGPRIRPQPGGHGCSIRVADRRGTSDVGSRPLRQATSDCRDDQAIASAISRSLTTRPCSIRSSGSTSCSENYGKATSLPPT